MCLPHSARVRHLLWDSQRAANVSPPRHLNASTPASKLSSRDAITVSHHPAGLVTVAWSAFRSRPEAMQFPVQLDALRWRNPSRPHRIGKLQFWRVYTRRGWW
jgi:hypothetical protein